MFRQRVGELMRSRGLTYSKFARSANVGMETARQLYEDPYYQMSSSTLYTCCKFFGVQPGDLLEIEPNDKGHVA